MQTLLRERIGTGDNTARPEAREEQPKPAAAAPTPPSRFKSRLTKSLLGLALVAIAGWMPAHRLFEVQSIEAVVNARVVSVRAPINGVVKAGPGSMTVGEPVEAGTLLANIDNLRADRNRLSDAIAELGEAREERDALEAKLANLKTLRADLAAQLAAFRDNRLRQIGARIAEADARIAAADAIAANAGRARQRQSALLDKGIVAPTALGDVDRDAAVANATSDEARAVRAALLVERDALTSGIYFGDSYNDQPRTAQRLDEIDEQIAAAKADIDRQVSRIARAEASVAREREAFELASSAKLSSPVGGRVWEVLTAPGEQVAAGQSLFSLLNCSQAIVTAVVSEAVYNSLSIGMPASFIFREGGEALPGRVVQLSGVATASSNFAIIPSALKKESYRVAVALDAPATNGSCAVGRTGRVVFGANGV